MITFVFAERLTEARPPHWSGSQMWRSRSFATTAIIPSMTSSRSTSEVRNRFLHRLERVQTSAELKSLLAECPPPTAVGYQFYPNLAFFIEHFVPPRGADVSETLQYIKLSEKLPLAAKKARRGGRERSLPSRQPTQLDANRTAEMGSQKTGRHSA